VKHKKGAEDKFPCTDSFSVLQDMLTLETEPRVETFVNKSLYSSKTKHKITQQQCKRERKEYYYTNNLLPLINHTGERLLYNCNVFLIFHIHLIFSN